MRALRTVLLLAALGAGLSGCVAYDVASTAVDAGASVAGAAVDVGTAVVSAPFGGGSDDKKDK